MIYQCTNKVELDIDYAEKYNLKDVQGRLKRIMTFIDKVCRENDINYTIAYGTQIGAFRHGGFIPWDDDMDIIMLREDYVKFKKLIEEKYHEEAEIMYYLWVERVILLDDPEYFIDIMILDNVPKNKLVALFKATLCRMFQGTMKEELDYDRYSFVYKVILKATGIVGRILGKKTCLKLYHKVQVISSKDKSINYIASYNSGFVDVNYHFKKEWFDEYIDVQFEELVLKSNSNFDEVLKFYYGDYMKLPPEAKRIPEHGR